MTIIGDAAEIAKRRRELFPHNTEADAIVPRLNGTSTNHCDICPMADHESCPKSCTTERDAQRAADGVRVY